MLKALLVTAVTLSSFGAVAQQTSPPKPAKATPPGKSLPLKRPSSANACADFGAGFVMIEGTSTCVKLGGSVSVGAGVSR